MFRLNGGCLEDEEDLENVDFRFFFFEIREYQLAHEKTC